MDRIGKFEVVRKIGKGGFGVVYEGRDPLIRRRVAIKTCSIEDEDIRKRFFREAEIAGNLQHRNIVTLFDIGIQEEVPYLVQEYLTGEDLSDKLRRGEAIPTRLKLDYLIQAAEGLEYAHTQGVVHRDIKPGNIRILDNGNVKIMDFGIAKLAGAGTQLTRTGMAMGTPGYLPPEQIRGEKVDQRADIFSYGVLAYELLGGIKPFRGDSMSAVIFQIIGQDPEPLSRHWPECPPPLETLVMRCLAKEPAKRFPSLSPVIAELKAVLDHVGETSAAPARGPARPPAPVQDPTAVDLQALRELERRLREAVERGDITAAELELTLARKKHGETQAFSQIFDPLERRIEEIRREWAAQRQRTERFSGLVERARALRSDGELDEARIALQAALELQVDSDEAQALLRSVDEAIEERERERRRELAAGAEAERIGKMLDAGELDRAHEALAGALRQHGEREVLVALERRLDELRVERRHAAVRERLAAAEGHERAGQLEQAQLVLREALQLEPADAEVQRFLARVTAELQRRNQEELRQKEIEGAIASVEAAITGGDVRTAGVQLSRYEKKLGDEPFRELRSRLKDAEVQAREAEKRQREAERQAREAEKRQRQAERESERLRQAAAKQARGGAASRPLPWAGIAAGVVVVAVLVGVGLWLWPRPPGPDEAGSAELTEPTLAPGPGAGSSPGVVAEATGTLSMTPPPPPAAPSVGRLALDAVPWAEVVSIVDASGRRHGTGQNRYTPLVLDLPAGEYRIELRHPELGTQTRSVRLAAGVAPPVQVVMGRIDPDDYFTRAGYK